tara:strand:- start:337 stop:648 length:312 start_codon:yes stop_codon:yes gene_type:complete
MSDDTTDIMIDGIKDTLDEHQLEYLSQTEGKVSKKDLAEKILKYVEKNPNSKAKKISIAVDATRQEVNSILYTKNREDKPHGLLGICIANANKQWRINETKRK